MRETFAHEAVLLMAPDADIRAPGGAITVALCGDWDHQPPCPLAPHHTSVDRAAEASSSPRRRACHEVNVRVLFATEADQEAEIRRRIDTALAVGLLDGPGGVTTTWQLQSSRASVVAADETAHAERLTHS